MSRSSSSLRVTLARRLSPADAAAYDAFVESARGGAWPQARSWAGAATAGRPLRPRWFLARRDARVVGAALVLVPAVPVSAIVERGPVVDDLDELAPVLAALRKATLLRGALRLQVMPYFAGDDARAAERILADAGFRDVQEFDGAHARSLRVDLTGDLFAGKANESLRRKLRQAEKAGATVRKTDDAAALERLYAELMEGQGRHGKPHAFFDALKATPGAIFVCEHEGQPVSALYASLHGKVSTFVLGASSSAERSFSKMAPAMAAAIRWAKEQGATVFDMGGFPLEGDPDEKRRSIAQFKLDFAKEPVSLVREHARWL